MDKSKPHNQRKVKKPHPKSHKSERVLLYGQHTVRAALANPKRQVVNIWASANAAGEIAPLLASHHPQIQVVHVRDLSRKLPDASVHQGLVIEAAPLKTPDLSEIITTPPTAQSLLVALDQVNEPRHIGALLRSAAVFGAQGVVIPRPHRPPIAGSLAKAASGALEIVPLIEVANLARALKQAQKAGYLVVGLDEAGDTALEDIPRNRPIMCVLGGEGKGLRRLTRESCDMLACLPNGAGDFTTLNVAAAGAIALYLLSRP